MHPTHALLVQMPDGRGLDALAHYFETGSPEEQDREMQRIAKEQTDKTGRAHTPVRILQDEPEPWATEVAPDPHDFAGDLDVSAREMNVLTEFARQMRLAPSARAVADVLREDPQALDYYLGIGPFTRARICKALRDAGLDPGPVTTSGQEPPAERPDPAREQGSSLADWLARADLNGRAKRVVALAQENGARTLEDLAVFVRTITPSALARSNRAWRGIGTKTIQAVDDALRAEGV